MKKVTSLFFIPSLLLGQTYRQVDGIPLSNVEASLVADQTISARQFNIPITEVGFTGGDHASQAFSSLSRSMVGTGAYYGLALNGSAYAALWNYVLFVMGPTTIAFFAADMGASLNTATRYYEFYAPVDGYYLLHCYLKGDIDYPNNHVVLRKYSGEQYIFDSVELSGSQSREYYRYLEHGGYMMSVGLGGGSSIIFHTAGSLDWIHLNDSQTRSWTVPILIARTSIPVPQLLTNIGSTANISVDFNGYPPSSNENCIDADPFVFSNLRPGENAIMRAGGGCTFTRYTTIGCEITRPTLSNAYLLSWDGTTATYNVTRGANEILTIDPP
jgi:hypothetical protein